MPFRDPEDRSDPRRRERSWLEQHGVLPRKRLGQNFLLDPRIPSEIVGRAGWRPDDPVLEIGPGGGALTAALLEAGHRVHAIEIDSNLSGLLAGRFATDLESGRLGLEVADVLEVDLAARLRPLAETGTRPWIAGNLPYSITTPILLRLLGVAGWLEGAVLMVQREYGERMLAGAGSDAYSSLSVRVAATATARSLLRVGRSAFWPRPGVESIVVELRFPQPPPYPGSVAALERVLRAAFGQRRKTLLNALSHGLGRSKEETTELLVAAGCDPAARAETLPLARFAALAERCAELGKGDGS